MRFRAYGSRSASSVDEFLKVFGDFAEQFSDHAGGHAQQAGEHIWAQGLYRFNTSAGNAKSSSFLSFRVMIEGSNGWVVPAQPGKYLAKKVVDEMPPKVNAAFAEAVDSSIK